MIRAREVALAAGVSISTVGRAMTDDPRISDETKAKVRASAEKLGYVGNNPARMMRGGSSNLIGLMIPDVANDFYSAIAQAMSDCLDKQGYRLVLALTNDDREVEARHIRELVGARAAGIILVPTAKPQREIRMLLKTVPHVQLLRQLPMLSASWFGIDDQAAIQRASSHLIELGHRRIAYIGGLNALSTGASRVEGYRSALREANIPQIPELERQGPPIADFGAAACRDLLSLPNPPTALITGSVHITEGVIAVLEDLRVPVPEALSVVGFGDSAWFSWWRGGLTAVAPPIHDLATDCAIWLLHHLANKGIKSAAQHMSFSHSVLNIRNSVGRPRKSGNGRERRAP